MKKILKTMAAFFPAVITLIFFISIIGFAASLFACKAEKQADSELSTNPEGEVSRAGAVNPPAARAGELSASPQDEASRVLNQNDLDPAALLQSLDEIADLERAGSWLQGMALTESTIREITGDIPGAVAAAYKELAFAYGKGLIKKEEKENGILSLLELKNDQTTEAASAILAFSRGEWEQASNALSLLFAGAIEEEPDSFANWMILVCALENQTAEENRRTSSAYRSIRARYAQFPEYWYRGARAFSGTIAAEYAENCINSSPEGPFARECRMILAEFTGLNSEDSLSIKTKREIEYLITQSVNTGNPHLLDSLMPLIGLPDNPYTVYAVGALRSLAGVPVFRDYFAAQAVVSSGRRHERLLYIANPARS